MFRKSILALSYRTFTHTRLARQVQTQVSPFACSRRGFSSAPHQNVPPGSSSTRKPPESGGGSSKALVGAAAIGASFIAAYSTGYLDDYLPKRQQPNNSPSDRSTDKLSNGGGISHDSEDVRDSIPLVTAQDSKPISSDVDDSEESTPVVSPQGENEAGVASLSDLKPKEEYTPAKVEEVPTTNDVHATAEKTPKSSPSFETDDNENQKYQITEHGVETGQKAIHKVAENLPKIVEAGAGTQGNNTMKDSLVEQKTEDQPKDVQDHSPEPLLDAYSLRDKVDESGSTPNENAMKHSSMRDEVSRDAYKDLSDTSISKDGTLILDFLQAIHAAEQRQAELDKRIFAEEKRAMKEKFEKELKDARARELMYAEEVAMLEKEVEKERAKAAAALKSLQERLEQRLKMELKEKDRESESKLKELNDFAKAELVASIAREKAAQVEKMAEADLNINALCMAFYARSEEARQTHSIHKLALGALALEDALSNGLPVQKELEALQVYLDGSDKDSLLQLALSSLPDDVRTHGTDNLLQLHSKFDALKGPLRHFSLIPPNGGGILAHSLAHLASFLKVKEGDQSGDGIESVINRVESLLAQGKLVEAANALEDGVRDSKAGEVVRDWLRRARNRAIAEQALILLQSYATSVSLS